MKVGKTENVNCYSVISQLSKGSRKSESEKHSKVEQGP